MAKKFFELKVDPSEIAKSIEEGKQKGWRFVNSVPQNDGQFLLQFEPDIDKQPAKAGRGCNLFGLFIGLPTLALLAICGACTFCLAVGAILPPVATDVPGSNSGGSSTNTETRYINSASGGNVFVRSGAGTSFETLGRLAHGAAVQVVAEQDGWYQIHFNDQLGWVASNLTSRSRPSNNSGSNSASQSGNTDQQQQPAAIQQPDVQQPAEQPQAEQPPAQQPAPLEQPQIQQPAPMEQPPQEAEQPSYSCGTCSQMSSCAQAYACLASNPGLDGNNNGIPCESICK